MDPALRDRVLEWRAVARDYDEQVDAVIVGTGCGGAVVAKELAAAGKSVLMLDRGGLYLVDRGDFDQREDNMFARIDGGRGLDTTDDGRIALTYGNNVGGASVHYWADTWRTPRDRCEKWAREFGVEGHGYDELVPYFERIERDLNVHAAEDARMNEMNRLFDRGARALGLSVERVMQARKNCVGSGYCMQGCAYDAKQSQLVTHIPAALAAGARIFADCEVESIELERGRAVGVRARFIDRRTCRPSGHRLRVRAKIVVAAAGGFNTAPLLLRSRIPDPSGQLGKNLQLNPCAQVFALFDQDVVMWRNIPAAVGVMSKRLARHDERGAYTGGGYLLHPNQLPPATLLSVLPGFGREHRELAERAHQIGGCIAWVDDVGSGSVALDDEGAPRWHYDISAADAAMLRDAMKLQARVLLAAGARECIIQDAPGTRIRDEKDLARIDRVSFAPGSIFFAAPHPAGMCRMGRDPARSVVNFTRGVPRGEKPVRLRPQRVPYGRVRRSLRNHHGVVVRGRARHARAMARLIALAALLAACGPPPPPKGPPPPRFHDRARGISFDPPAPPFLRSETDSANSVAHFADPQTRAGIHLLAFAASGPTDVNAARIRGAAYMRGLEESVAGLQVLGQRPLERFGLQGIELEYDGGAEPRMRTIDWILFAPGQVYVVKVTAPAVRFAELATPLLASRATIAITVRKGPE